MKEKWLNAYMDTAERFAQLSTAQRLQCGAILVKDDRIISIGYNGTPAGWDNVCEENNVTKPEVLHAETNCIAKVAQSSESSKDATMFSTHMPCMECAKLIYQSGIKTVYYRHKYRKDEGIKFLRLCGVAVNELDIRGSDPRDAS